VTTALWMLYLADVVSGLQVVLAILGGCALCSAAFGVLFATIEEEAGRPEIKPALLAGAALVIAAALLPSKTTLYAIAAVNVGETAIHTPTGDKALRALNAWLDRQIAGEEKK
jgi:hypothetical protein